MYNPSFDKFEPSEKSETDDVSITRTPRSNAKGLSFPDPHSLQEVCVQEFLRQLQQPECAIQKKSEGYERIDLESQDVPTTRFETDFPEGDPASPKSPSECDLSLLDCSLEQAQNLPTRQQSLFRAYDMASSSSEQPCAGATAKLICKRLPQQRQANMSADLLLEMRRVTTTLHERFGEMEPLFCTAAVFDLATRQRISESFHFDMASEDSLSAIPSAKHAHRASKLRNALLRLAPEERSPTVYLVLRISKVLEGDEDMFGEMYSRPDKFKESDAPKIKKQGREMCARLGMYRQPLAWGAVQLFGPDGNLINEMWTMNEFYRCKGVLSDSETMDILREPELLKKQRPLPATCSFRMLELFDLVPEYTDEGVLKISITEGDVHNTLEAREIRVFPTRPVPSFHSTYINDLYIYPESFVVGSRPTGSSSASSSARNISCTVQIRDSDAMVESDGLELVYGCSSEPLLSRSASTQISYHNKHPSFNDEIKVKLPAVITPNHHLFFTFHHVSCQAKADKPLQSLVGHAILPLYPQGQLTQGPKDLPVITDFASLRDYNRMSGHKLMENGKECFRVTLRPVSTVFSLDPQVSAFFHAVDPPPYLPPQTGASDREVKLLAAIQGLAHASPMAIVQSAPVLFNQLLRVMCIESTPVRTSAFSMFFLLVNTVAQADDVSSGRSPLLTQYVETIFDSLEGRLPSGHTTLVFVDFAREWLRFLHSLSDPAGQESQGPQRPGSSPLLRTRTASVFALSQKDEVAKSTMQNCWFGFDLIRKSIAIHLSANGKLADSCPRRGRLDVDSSSMLTTLVEALSQTVFSRRETGLGLAKTLNCNLALFMRDLFDLVDCGLVLGLVLGHVRTLDGTASNLSSYSVAQELKTDFLRIVVDYEQYVQLSLPAHAQLTPGEGVSADALCERYGLCGILIQAIKEDLKHNERTVRQNCLKLIRELLAKHDMDARYQDPSQRRSIATMYFPFVLVVTDLFQSWSAAAESRLRIIKAKIDRETTELDRIRALAAESTPESPSSSSGPASPAGGPGRSFEDLANAGSGDTEAVYAQKSLDEARRELAEEEARVAEEQRQMLVCFLWVVDNMDRATLREWWRKESHSQSRLSNFMRVLGLCVNAFQNPGSERIRLETIALRASNIVKGQDAKTFIEEKYAQLDAGKRVLIAAPGGSGTGTVGSVRAFRQASLRSKEPSPFVGGGGAATPGLRTSFASPEKPPTAPRHSSAMLRSQLSPDLFVAPEQQLQSTPRLSFASTELPTQPGSRLSVGGSTPGVRDFRKRLNGSTNKALSLGVPARDRNSPPSNGLVDEATEELIKKITTWRAVLTHDVGLRLLSVILDFAVDVYLKDPCDNGDLTETFWDTVFSFLRTNQSEQVILCTFGVLRHIVSGLRRTLFTTLSPQCESLACEVLRHCNFRSPAIRLAASAALYLLIKMDFDDAGNFHRLRAATTIALSKLVQEIQDDKCLKGSFECVAAYAEKENLVKPHKHLPPIVVSSQDGEESHGKVGLGASLNQRTIRSSLPFPAQVAELAIRWSESLQDTLQISQLTKTGADNETLADLYHRIATGYVHAPQLRVVWLGHLAEFNSKRENFVEAALCHVCIAAVVMDHLESLRDNKVAAAGVDKQHLVTMLPSLAHETREDRSDITILSEPFSERGFVHSLRRAINLMEQAQHYEYINDLYAVLIPLMERARDYEGLANAHDSLAVAFRNVVDKNKKRGRLFGSYYRVGYYGRLVGELDGKEFIYKMPKITQLPEIREYLENFFVAKHGQDVVHIITGSKPVDLSTLDPNHVYIQITSVQPYFSPSESAERQNYFERNTHLSRFIFETPFTKSGKSHGELVDQWKRKTILSTEQPFPFLMTRIPVVGREEIVLTPVENSIEILEGRNRKLAEDMELVSTFGTRMINNLQLSLQGSVRLQVNAGAQEIVRTFLGEEGIKTSPPECTTRLRQQLREFLRLCDEGIRLDKKYVGPEQLAFHNELEIGFKDVQAFFTPYLQQDGAEASEEEGARGSRRVKFSD